MALEELTQNEIEEVAGAGLFGNSLQAGSNIISGVLNVAAPIGKLISLVPGVGIAHYLGDSVIQTVTDSLYKAGTQAGGTLPQQKMHLAEESKDGTYNPLGIFKYFF